MNFFRIALLGTLMMTLAAAPGHTRGRKGHKADRKGHGEQKNDPSFFSKDFIKTLDEHLELSKEQKSGIKDLIAKNKPEFEKKKKELKALKMELKAAAKDMQASLFETKEEIRDSLTMEQKQKFDRIITHMEMQRRRKHMRIRMMKMRGKRGGKRGGRMGDRGGRGGGRGQRGGMREEFEEREIFIDSPDEMWGDGDSGRGHGE